MAHHGVRVAEAGNAGAARLHCRSILSSRCLVSAVLSLDHLDAIRLAEIDKIVPFLPPGARVLDLGAGTGKQALELQRRGFDVTAIEIADSNYATQRVFPITDYDGRTIPLADASVDVVFSSNVLEHVADLVAYACRNSSRAGAGRQLSSRPSDPHMAALDHAGDPTSRRSRFRYPRCRSFFRRQRRAPPNCSDCGKPGTALPGIRSASAFPDGTASAATSSPSCGCSIPAGGGGISATTALPSSRTSRWDCSTPAKCCLGCAWACQA